MKNEKGYIYIMSNRHRSVLYIGVTADLYNRVWQHKNGQGSIFTKRYNCTDLLYWEFFYDIREAITREKQLKKWNRAWKEQLILEVNPTKKDLFDDVFECR